MDAGGLHPLREAGSRRDNFQSDRFIPVRSGMDFDVARQMLTQPRRQRERIDALLRSDDAYQKLLVEVLLQNRTRILAFNNRPRPPVGGFFDVDGVCSSPPTKPTTARRRHIPQTADRVLDAPELMDDYSLNLLDWGRSNLISIALGYTVCLWDADKGSAAELMNVDEDKGPVTSVCWAPDGQHIAVGLNSSDIQLWDLSSHRLLRVLQGVHESRVGSMAWNSNTILTTGGLDGLVANSDMRVRSHVVQTFRGHQSEVCGLKWTGSGRQLASGGNDKLLHIWDMSVASAHPRPINNRWVHRFEGHLGAVRALAWCPFQDNMIASGGGAADQSIKFWNTQTGDCLNSIDASSQVCGLLWSRNERELLSSHGGAQNQLSLWKYPSMVKIRDLVGHSSRVLFLAQSPDGSRVASAAGAEDETLRVWNVFGTPDAPKPAARGRIRGSFTDIIQIRLRAPL